MSDVSITPTGTTMTTTKHKPARRRGAKLGPRARKGYRNAAPRPASSRPTAGKGDLTDTVFQRIGQLVPTALGAGAASLGGALATRWGFHPQTVAIALGALGVGIAAKSDTKEWQRAGAGAFSAGGSQLVLLTLRKAQQQQSRPAPPSPPAPRPKNADLGALPPGALDAAFERARAALAVDADPYAHEHDHMG
jgi:hypothetical protein